MDGLLGLLTAQLQGLVAPGFLEFTTQKNEEEMKHTIWIEGLVWVDVWI